MQHDRSQFGDGTPLPDALRVRMEWAFETDFRGVRVRIGSEAECIGARAFAFGDTVYFAPGEYDPVTPSGLALLGHELAHVQQQRAGRTTHRRPRALLSDVALEAEAIAAGARVARGLPVERSWVSGIAPLPLGMQRDGPIQACFYCADLTCLKGEKCKQGADLGGLFSPGIVSPKVGPHKETRKSSKRNVRESEHMFPASALKQSGASHNLQTEPTISIPYSVHRGGVSGAGGGISSTGSSSTAKGWSAHLGQTVAQGGWYEGIRQAAVDGINSAAVNGTLNEGTLSGYMQVVNGHAMMGRITQEEAGTINSTLYFAYLNWKTRGMAT